MVIDVHMVYVPAIRFGHEYANTRKRSGLTKPPALIGHRRSVRSPMSPREGGVSIHFGGMTDIAGPFDVFGPPRGVGYGFLRVRHGYIGFYDSLTGALRALRVVTATCRA